MRRFLESKPFTFLGGLSFPIYGLHWLVMSSVGCYLVNHMPPGNSFSMILIYLCCLGITVLLAMVAGKINRMVQTGLVDPLFDSIERRL